MIAGGAIIRLYTGHTAWLVSSRRDMRSKQSSKLDRMKRSWSVRLPLSPVRCVTHDAILESLAAPPHC
jgi:hypothetical protein